MNRSTRIKACVLSVLFTAVLLLAPFSPVQADSFPTYFNVNENNFYSAANIYVAYMELDQDQQDIANYLLGMYNLMYLGSRGFAFERGAYSSESTFIAKIKSFGYRLFYNASGIALQSRMDYSFCKYASAVLLYASQCNNVDFNTWFSNLDDDFIIPVDQGILNSFTLLYNDNSDVGISSFGDVNNPWDSGVKYNYLFSELEFRSNEYSSKFLNFVNTYNFILWSKQGTSWGNPMQYGYGLDGLVIPNCIFVKRGSTYSQYRYGNVNVSSGSPIFTYNFSSVDASKMIYCEVQNGYVTCPNNSAVFSFISSIQTGTSNNDLSNFIDSIIHLSPVFAFSQFENAYPYIAHVFLVDDLNSLNNPVEVFNNESWDILGLSGDMITPIDTVNLKPKVLTTINLPDNTQSSVSIRDMINDDNVVDDQDQPTDPWQVNVIVQPNDTNPISVDVNMFSSGSVYLDYLWEHTRKVVVFAKDVLDCFEFNDSGGDSYGPKFAIYGVLVLGVAGGMIAKFLL